MESLGDGIGVDVAEVLAGIVRAAEFLLPLLPRRFRKNRAAGLGTLGHCCVSVGSVCHLQSY